MEASLDFVYIDDVIQALLLVANEEAALETIQCWNG